MTRRFVLRFVFHDRGATGIEYGLIIALMCVAILGALTAFAGAGTGMFNKAMETISAAISG